MDHPTNRTNANPSLLVREPEAVGMTHHPDMALVAGILTNALRRMYEEELAAELQATGQTTVTAEVDERVWAKIEADLASKRPNRKAESRRVLTHIEDKDYSNHLTLGRPC